MKNDREIARIVLERRDAILMARRKRRKRIAQAAALCLIAVFSIRIWQAENDISAFDTSADGAESSNPVVALDDSNNPNALAKNSNSNTGAPLPQDAGEAITSAAASSAGSDSGEVSRSTEQQASLPVSYSSLSLPQGQIRPEILSHYSAVSQSTAEILPFSEDMLSESSAILEGTITDIYLKQYTYDTYNDKFGPKELYHNQSSSVVYKLTVDRVWYGDESLSDTSVLIEDDTYLMDSYFSLKAGRSYVIPVCDLDSELQIWEEYAGGDLTRDGRYTTLYPHHPQIEVTMDGDYIVTTDWDTLCPDNALDVELDIPENTLVEYHPENPAGENGLITTEWRTLMISVYDAVYYYDKLKLVESDEFFIQLNRLIDSLP
ncbi:hypothetical protein [Acetatifactor aquisgranensis]|uniref:hypothetical protein n=1 Tax=Acetatifactor aquisgranensis TaxID=2941233 RepID=UPI00203C4AE2|nr:hypothetical protein [Acetatifactor aquisgranensis]